MQHSKKTHPFHIVELSPLPILTAIALFFFCLGVVLTLHENHFGKIIFGLSSFAIIFLLFLWWRGVVREGLFDKAHTPNVNSGFKVGMVLFIFSEIMFFVCFFFSFFHASLIPAGLLDGDWVIAPGIWPPKGIKTLDPWDIPFINTIVLLLSGTTVTWAHYSLEHGDIKEFKTNLAFTVILGVFFTLLQAFEYSHADFTLKDGVYGSNFYLITGFHGFHVIIGTIFLAVCYFRAVGNYYDRDNYLGFEFAAWYWHFVDVIWLFVFMFIYIFGS